MDESTFVGHEPCPKCGSSDALGRYDDGHGHCFGCGYRERAEGTAQHEYQEAPEPSPKLSGGFKQGDIRPLTARAISLDTCKAFGYACGPGIQIAPYTDEMGNVVAQKIRAKDKSFGWVGDAKAARLFGKQLWKGCDKRQLIITEGEIDTLTIYEITRGQEPVVSLQNGAQAAVRSFKADLEWLESFDSVVLCFDNDEPGIDAAKACAALLSPGKAKIVELPLKDANDMLKAGRSADLYKAIRAAKVWRPDGLVLGEDLIDDILADDPEADALYPWEGLNTIARGLRFGELVTVTAGIGTGKTSFLTEIVYALQQAGHKVGMLMLEEATKFTGRRLVGHHLNVPLQVSRAGVDKEDIRKAAHSVLGSNGVVLYDHQGETDIDNLLTKVRYMVQVLGIRFVVIDNLSAIVAGLDERDERKAIDRIMRALWQLAQREGIVMFLAVHLKRIEGNKGHEDGVQTSLSHLRGSQSIASNSNLVLGIERDQQGEDPDLATVRVLKNRLTGETGIACRLRFSKTTGRLGEDAGSPFGPAQREPNPDFE